MILKIYFSNVNMYYLNNIYLISELSDIIFITEMIEKSCMYYEKFSLN